MKRTISAMRGPGSLNHNRRSFTAENVDPKRSSLNVVYRDEPIQKVYHELFDEAVKRYNAKQKRKDRCITDYYEHLRTGKQEKLFHELIVQIGNKDDMGVLTENGALAKELLDEYMQGFQERNPTLRVFGAFLHMDEATPHLHIDFVPYVSSWKGKGLDTKVSLKQALKALGFAGGSKRESELNQWINAEKEQLAAVMERHGIEWEQKGTHEEHLSVLDFKKQERSSLNVIYRDEPIQKVYHELFDEAVNRYNAKQKRKDRCINDYYEHLRTGKQEKLFHELIVQIGNKDDTGVLTENGALAKELLDEYMQGFQERNPTLRVFGAFLHMDEATPHLHIDFVPYVSGWKGKGLDTKVSLKQALKALGFAGGSKRESELNQWINAEKEQLAAVMERHGIEWEQKGTHEEHLSVLDFKKQERSKEVAALEAAKQECQTDLTEMQEQLETAQTAVEAAEQRVQKAELTYQKQSQKLNKLAPIMEGLENLSAQYSQRPEEWVPEAATFETAKSYREKKAMPLIQKLVKVLFALHRKYWEVKDERDKYLHFYQDEKKATHHLSQRLKEVEAENSQFYAMKRDFRRVWNYFGAEKMQQVIGLMREREQTAKQDQQENRKNSIEL